MGVARFGRGWEELSLTQFHKFSPPEQAVGNTASGWETCSSGFQVWVPDLEMLGLVSSAFGKIGVPNEEHW